eukprot:279095_1
MFLFTLLALFQLNSAVSNLGRVHTIHWGRATLPWASMSISLMIGDGDQISSLGNFIQGDCTTVLLQPTDYINYIEKWYGTCHGCGGDRQNNNYIRAISIRTNSGYVYTCDEGQGITNAQYHKIYDYTLNSNNGAGYLSGIASVSSGDILDSIEFQFTNFGFPTYDPTDSPSIDPTHSPSRQPIDVSITNNPTENPSKQTTSNCDDVTCDTFGERCENGVCVADCSQFNIDGFSNECSVEFTDKRIDAIETKIDTLIDYVQNTPGTNARMLLSVDNHLVIEENWTFTNIELFLIFLNVFTSITGLCICWRAGILSKIKL